MEAFEQKPDELEQFLDFMDEDLENVRRVIDFCEEKELEAEFKIHGKSETAKESAEKTDVNLEQIVKTLVFIAGEQPVAVLCPGSGRVSEEKLEEVTDEEVRMANPSEVEESTDYVIGGVSPFDLDIPVYMEEELLEQEVVKPAAGSRVVGVTVNPEELKETIDAETFSIVE